LVAKKRTNPSAATTGAQSSTSGMPNASETATAAVVAIAESTTGFRNAPVSTQKRVPTPPYSPAVTASVATGSGRRM
jgi:hypothetical protein